MKELEKLKKEIIPLLEKYSITLYEMKWYQETHGRTLRVSIMKDDGSIDVDTCAQVSDALSQYLDEKDPFDFVYYLEVCSPGAERQLQSATDIEGAIDKYIHIDLKEAILGLQSYEGELLSYENGILKLRYREKTRSKVLEIPESEIKMIRLAVKF